MHDAGGKSLFSLQPGVVGQAYLTPDERHRLWLSRRWGPGANFLLIGGLNPSTARPDFDDPTIRRDIGFAQRLGYDGVFKVNAITYRCTDPAKLPADGLVHDENFHVLNALGRRCSTIVLAYGAAHKRLTPFIDEMVRVLRTAKPQLWCFGRTAAGHPRHTLYLKSDTALQEFK